MKNLPHQSTQRMEHLVADQQLQEEQLQQRTQQRPHQVRRPRVAFIRQVWEQQQVKLEPWEAYSREVLWTK